MNDPHIEALHYSVRHADYVDYDNAGPLSHDTPGFTVRIENGRAEITMKSHYATVEAARSEVEPFLRGWELMAALRSRPGEFEFAYDRPTIVDRNPLAGADTDPVRLTIDHPLLGETSKPHAANSKYPDPPAVAFGRDAAVDLMFDRFRRYRAGNSTLPDAANFCLTTLELSSGGRKAAAARYGVAMPILNKLGELAANKGGNEARKASGAEAAFSAAERQWLEEAMNRVIYRAAEIAGGPSANLPQITMADLPSLP